ncbi:MAG: OsmC family protein [Proteobacteria bacterium]|jgi:putative redox protein|nr:OsmC family protein [Pseudomonadota bacterium]
MKATVKLLDGVSFEGIADSGHSIVMDGPPDYGGQEKGIRPMEAILVGMGGCASFDVVYILRKSQQQVDGCECEMEAERADEDPKVFIKVNMHFKVSGDDLKDRFVKRAVELSAEKYCSASVMIGKTAEITHSYEIV